MNCKPPTHPLVLALLNISRQVLRARTNHHMKPVNPGEMLAMADADTNQDNAIMRPRENCETTWPR